MNSFAPHPATLFKAPTTIVAGSPLKDLIGRPLIKLISESFANAVPGFHKRLFERNALKGLPALELFQRGEHIARAMHVYLPHDFKQAVGVLIASLGPELTETAGNGLAPFFYLPHTHYAALFGISHFEEGMRANYELTKRFSAEFSVRPFLVRYPDHALGRLRQWTKDPHPHVRRLVSEGTRPRLPWSTRLPQFQREPAPVLALLELLKDDPSLYVRRSIANNLGDIAKDHPNVVYQTCQRWLDEITDDHESKAKARCWMIRHAVRLPARMGVSEALRLRRDARV